MYRWISASKSLSGESEIEYMAGIEIHIFTLARRGLYVLIYELIF